MSRLGYLARNPKRTLGALSTLLVAAGLTVGSGAYFTDTDSSVANSATAAEFGITMIGSATPAFDAYNCTDAVAPKCHDNALDSDPAANADDTTFQIGKLVPSNTRTYTRNFAVRNDGNVPAKVNLKAVDVTGDAPLFAALKVTAGAVTNGASSLGLTDADVTTLNKVITVPANKTWEYQLTFKLPDDGDQTALQGKGGTLTIKALAVDTNQSDPQIP